MTQDAEECLPRLARLDALCRDGCKALKGWVSRAGAVLQVHGGLKRSRIKDYYSNCVKVKRWAPADTLRSQHGCTRVKRKIRSRTGELRA